MYNYVYIYTYATMPRPNHHHPPQPTCQSAKDGIGPELSMAGWFFNKHVYAAAASCRAPESETDTSHLRSIKLGPRKNPKKGGIFQSLL